MRNLFREEARALELLAFFTIAEQVEKAELICQLNGVKCIESIILI